MSDLDITRQLHGLPVTTPVRVVARLDPARDHWPHPSTPHLPTITRPITSPLTTEPPA